MSQPETNVVILGAGPAGATTSIFLAKHKIDHIILDKATFPRDKICGDAMSGKVISVLKSIDPAFVFELDKDDTHYAGCWGVQFIAPNGQPLDVPFRGKPEEQEHAPGFISKRMDFDNFLVNKIDEKYATKWLGCDVKDVIDHQDHFEIIYKQNGEEKSSTCRMVIGAEGDRSIVAKKLAGHKMNPKYYAAGLRAYYENVTGMHPQKFIELHYIKEILPGYLWVFPLPGNQANVGIGLLSEKVRSHKLRLRDMMETALKTNANLKERFKNARVVDDAKGWGLPLGSIKRDLSGRGYLLTGDAGSLIDPFTGEGIGNAMVSGRYAAETIAEAIKANDYSADFLKMYDQKVYDRLWKELKLSYTIQRLLKYPWLFNFVANRATKNKTIQETMMFMFDDINIRSKLKSPSFYFKMLFNS